MGENYTFGVLEAQILHKDLIDLSCQQSSGLTELKRKEIEEEILKGRTQWGGLALKSAFNSS